MTDQTWWSRWRRRRDRRLQREQQQAEDFLRLGAVRLEDRRVLDAAGLVADIQPGASGSVPAGFTEFNGLLYFSAAGVDSQGSDVGRELFQIDPTTEVSLSADIQPGSGSSDPGGFTPFDGRLYFAATSQQGRELFKVDGDGVVSQVADINSGVASSDPSGFVAFNGSLYFSATGSEGRELYRLDSQEEIQLAADVFAGDAGGQPLSSNPTNLTAFDGGLYFAATAGEGRELWVLNSAQEFEQVGDIHSGLSDANPEELTVYNEALYFAATSSEGRTLFRQGPSDAVPQRVLDPAAIVDPEELTVADGLLFFRANNLLAGSQLFRLDNSEDVSAVVTDDGRPLEMPATFTSFNGSLYFAADTVSGRSLFRLVHEGDVSRAVELPLPAGTQFTFTEPRELAVFPEVAGKLYFRALGPAGRELYRLGADDQITFVADIHSGPFRSDPGSFVVFSNSLYFAATTSDLGRELYRFIIADSNVEIEDDDLVFSDTKADEDNRVVVVIDGDHLKITDENGHSITSSIPGVEGLGSNTVRIPLSELLDMQRFVADTRGGNDSLTLDLAPSSGTLLELFAEFAFDAGTHRPETAGDVLRLSGSETATASLTPSATSSSAGNGTIRDAAQTSQLTYTAVEAADLTRFARAELSTAATATGDHLLSIDSGLDALDAVAPTLVVTGTTAGQTLAPYHFFANQTFSLDASAAQNGDHQLAFQDGSDPHGNVNLLLDSGGSANTGSDLVRIEGPVRLEGSLGIVANRFLADAVIEVGGDAVVDAQEDVVLTASASVLATGAGTIAIAADTDQLAAEPLVMAAGSRIEAVSGQVQLTAGGDVIAAQVVSGFVGGEAIRIESKQGRIVDSSANASVNFAAPDGGVTLAALHAIGSIGPGAIDLQTAAIEASSSTADVVLTEVDDLSRVSLAAANGRVDLSLGGGLFDAAGDNEIDITAQAASITAARVGSESNPVETQVGQIELRAASGGVSVHNVGDLEVGGVSAVDGVRLEIAGLLTIAEQVSTEAGNISLISDDLLLRSLAMVQIVVGSGALSVTSETGIAMEAGAVLAAASGDVLVSTSGLLQTAAISTEGRVVVAAAAVTDVNGDDGNIEAGHLEVVADVVGSAEAGQALDFAADSLVAAATGGSLFLRGSQSVRAVDLFAPDGDIHLALAGGSLTVQSVAAGGKVVLDAAADIVDDGDPLTGLAAEELVLRAGAGVGLVGAAADAAVETATQRLVVEAVDGFSLDNQSGELLVTSAVAGAIAAQGRIRHAGGDLATGLLSLPGPDSLLELHAVGGRIQSVEGGPQISLSAASISLTSLGAIGGSAAPLQLAAERLEALSQMGGVYIAAAQDVAVANVLVANGDQGVVAASEIVIQSGGKLSLLAQTVLTQAGPISFAAADSISLQNEIHSAAGDLRLVAGGDLFASSNSRIFVVSGDILLSAERGTLTANGQIVADNGQTTFFVGSAGGSLAGSVDGSTGLRKEGQGSLHVTESSHNRYTGETEVVSGELRVDGLIGSQRPAGRVTMLGSTLLSGGGDIRAPLFASAPTARILPTGDLSLGDGSAFGFDFAGILSVDSGQTVTLRDADFAQLGRTTVLAPLAVLDAVNGVEVSGGESLSGSGFVDGEVRVLAAGTLAPGSSVGVLTVGQLDMRPGSILSIEIDGVAPGDGYDQVVVLQGVAIAGARLEIAGQLFNAPPAGTEFVIVRNDGGGAVAGRFANAQGQVLDERSAVNFNGIETFVSYVGGDSNDISLNVGGNTIIFVPPSGGSGSDGTGSVSVSGLLLIAAEEEAGRGEFEAAILVDQEAVQLPPGQTIIERRQAVVQQRRVQTFRIYFKVVNDALQTEWPKEYDLPIRQYDGTALAQALEFFRNSQLPDGHYRVYVLEPGATRPIVLADIFISGGKIVPPNYREEPGGPSAPAVRPGGMPGRELQDDAADLGASDAGSNPLSRLRVLDVLRRSGIAQAASAAAPQGA